MTILGQPLPTYGQCPSAFRGSVHGANTYDGTQMLLMAMDNAYPTITGEAIAAAFHKIAGYDGLQGTFNVQANGETINKTQLGVWKDGKLTPYTP